MTDQKSNIDHLHEEGIIDKEQLTDEQKKAVDSLSKKEVEDLKSMHKNVKDNGANPVGIIV